MLIIQIALGIVLAVIILSLLPVLIWVALAILLVGAVVVGVVLVADASGARIADIVVATIVVLGLVGWLREWWSKRQDRIPVVTIDVDESSDALLEKYQRKAAETRRRNAAKRRKDASGA